MGFKRAADGVTESGKTKGKNLGDTGPTKGIENGPAKKSSGGLNADMKKVGRNMARVNNQKRG